MNRIIRPLSSAAILLALFATGAQAELDPRLRGCYDTFLQCIDAVPEQGADGRYPLAREQACEVAYERCKVQLGFSPAAGRPGYHDDPTLPQHD